MKQAEEYLTAIQIVDEEVKYAVSLPRRAEVAVFSFENAKKAFHYMANLNFVVCLNEETHMFMRCANVMECENFYKM